MEYRSEVNVSENETEEETVFPSIDIGYPLLSPCCDVTSASTKVSLERSSFNEELVLESDPEDVEDECPCDLTVIVKGPGPCVPFMETCYSFGSKSFKLATHFLFQDMYCSKRLFEAVKFCDKVKGPIAKIELVIIPNVAVKLHPCSSEPTISITIIAHFLTATRSLERSTA